MIQGPRDLLWETYLNCVDGTYSWTDEDVVSFVLAYHLYSDTTSKLGFQIGQLRDESTINTRISPDADLVQSQYESAEFGESEFIGTTGFEIKALTPQGLTKSQLNKGKGQADTLRIQPEGYTGSAFRYVYLAVPDLEGMPGASREWIADFQRGLEDIHVGLVDIKPYSVDVLVDAEENPRYNPKLDRVMVRQLTLEYDGIQSLWRTGSLEAMAQRLEQKARKRPPRELNQWQQSVRHRLRQQAYATRSG